MWFRSKVLLPSIQPVRIHPINSKSKTIETTHTDDLEAKPICIQFLMFFTPPIPFKALTKLNKKPFLWSILFIFILGSYGHSELVMKCMLKLLRALISWFNYINRRETLCFFSTGVGVIPGLYFSFHLLKQMAWNTYWAWSLKWYSQQHEGVLLFRKHYPRFVSWNKLYCLDPTPRTPRTHEEMAIELSKQNEPEVKNILFVDKAKWNKLWAKGKCIW